jgi:hypothetical protein
MDYPALGTLRGLLNLLGYSFLVIGVIVAFSSASERFDFNLLLFILLVASTFLVVLPVLVLAELIQLFVDMARAVSTTRFTAESINKQLKALHELEMRREQRERARDQS